MLSGRFDDCHACIRMCRLCSRVLEAPITDNVRDYVPYMEKGSRVGVNQLVHWFLGGKGLGIQQGMSECMGGWIGSSESLGKYKAV